MKNYLKRRITAALMGLSVVAGVFGTNTIKAEAYGRSDELSYLDSWSGFQRDAWNLPADATLEHSIVIGRELTPDDYFYSYGVTDMWVMIDAINEAHGDEAEDKWHQGYPQEAMNCAFESMMNGSIPADGYYIMFDYGYFTEYVDYFKAKGWISPAYQLPDTFYTMETKKDYSYPYVMYDCGEYEQVRKYHYTHATDCAYVTEWNMRRYRVLSTLVSANFKSEDARYGLGEYIPKFYLEDNGTVNAPLPYMELLQNWVGNDDEFNAYDYYVANPALQQLYGADPIALYSHFIHTKYQF